MKRLAKSRWLATLVLAIFLASAASLAEACPLCKEALNNSEQAGGDVVAGYFWSILFMMSMPFLLLGSFSGYMYLAVRKARREQEAQATAARNNRPVTPAPPELVEV